jgi:hypothetical protein
MIRQQLVYLVGPITGLSYQGCTEWRDAVKEELEATGRYHCFTPMRGKKHLKENQDIPATIPEHIRRPGCSGHDILARDYYDCTRADVIFCNLAGAEIPSIGSMFELAWSYANPNSFSVVILDGEANPHWHAFVIQAGSVVFPTLEEGVKYMKDVLNS